MGASIGAHYSSNDTSYRHRRQRRNVILLAHLLRRARPAHVCTRRQRARTCSSRVSKISSEDRNSLTRRRVARHHQFTITMFLLERKQTQNATHRTSHVQSVAATLSDSQSPRNYIQLLPDRRLGARIYALGPALLFVGYVPTQ